MKVTKSILKAGWIGGFLVVYGVALAAPAIEQVRNPIDLSSTMSEVASNELFTGVSRAGSRLVAVGDRGIILTSDDQGITWLQRPSPVSVLLTSVYFIDEMKGWAAGHGGVVLSTTDKGESWVKVQDGRQLANQLLESAMANAAAISEEGEETRTQADDEVFEAKLLVKDGPDKPFLSIYADEEIGLLVVGAFGLFLHSRNGGATWESWQNRVPNPMGNHLYSVFRSGKSLYLVGEQGSVFRSDDLGQSFVNLSAPYEGSFFGAVPMGEQGLMAFGLRGNAFVYQEQQGWQRVEVPTIATINSGVRLKDGSVVLATQAGEALHYRVNAQSFVKLEVPSPAPFVGIDQLNEDAVVLAGARGITLVSIKSLESRL